ncbi:MAG: TolB family protein [Bryobacteraceae bacterium]
MKRALAIFCLGIGATFGADSKLGIFEAHADVGETPQKGSVEFDASTGEYRVTGGGANIWTTVDAFEFVSKQVSGDMAFTADVHFVGAGAVQHRKAALMIRQSLDPGSAYADVALHGDGLTSLQYRPEAGALTKEVRSDLKAPVRIRIERHGNDFTMLAGNPGEELKPAGPVTVALQDPVYVGLAVSSHNADVLETAVFSNVKIESLARPPARPQSRSKISIYTLKDKSTEVIYTADKIFEAPNWSPDGKYLLINSGGSLWRLPLGSQSPEPGKIDLGSISGCNNDHGISPDGKTLAFSARSGAPASQVYVASSDGSNARLMTPKSPSYYHGWSPDGKWLAMASQRDGNFDIYRVPVTGGDEQRLTSSPGYDDGPDYSPDGKWIYINSDRTGMFQIWRFPAEGAGPDDKLAEQVVKDEYEDWFPHPSPDGKWMVFISFPKGTKGHPANQNVQLRMMPLPRAKLKVPKIQTIVNLFGGQGTMNVNSWSPDSKKFAFVTYEPLSAGGSK